MINFSVGIDIAHNCPPDTGARGLKQEDLLVMEVGQLAIKQLKEEGIKVVECKPNKANRVKDSLQSRCDAANNAGVDLFCSLHFNAFNGVANGAEVFAISQKGQAIAKSILEEIVELGYFNRKVKDGSHLYVLRNTNMPAVLVEFAFCDSQKDMDRYNASQLANAFVKGILNGIQAIEKPQPRLRAVTNNFEFATLRVNHACGGKVERLQSYFGLNKDSFFDTQLEEKIKEKQFQHEMAVTGCVDEALWDLLFPN